MLESFLNSIKMEKKKRKPITIRMVKCKKCKGKLEYRFTTELEEDSTDKPEMIIVMGLCKKCEIIFVTNLIKTDDIPQSLEELEEALKEKNATP